MPIHAHPCPPIVWHVPTHAIQIAPMYSKLCNVYYPPTPSLGWIGQIKGRSLSLASAQSTSWLAYSLHPRSLTPICSWMHGCTKPMPTHARPWTITSHPCPPKTHGHGHGWAWVGMGMGMGTQCRALVQWQPVGFVKSPGELGERRMWNRCF
jgi:hypothetical protein